MRKFCNDSKTLAYVNSKRLPIKAFVVFLLANRFLHAGV